MQYRIIYYVNSDALCLDESDPWVVKCLIRYFTDRGIYFYAMEEVPIGSDGENLLWQWKIIKETVVK